MSRHDDKKDRKKALLKKNRQQFEIFNMLRLRWLEATRVKQIEKEQKPQRREEPKSEEKEVLWSEKTATIRNRLTDKKRHSRERWNRFAGTSDGGSRGL